METASAQPRRVLTFALDCPALTLFGYSLLMGVSQALVFFGAWGASITYTWFAGQVKCSSGARVSFVGSYRAIWPVFFAQALLSHTTRYAGGTTQPMSLIASVGTIVLGFYSAKWAVEGIRLETPEGTVIPQFRGTLGEYVKWILFFMVSMITVVGWAWVGAAFARWYARNTELPSGATVHFNGSAVDILWRSVVMLLLFLPVVTIPWATRWLAQWYIGQVTIER